MDSAPASRFAGCIPAGAKSDELKAAWLAKKALFYIARSMNDNAVCYEANVGPDGALVPGEPVKVYWCMYSAKEIHEEVGVFFFFRARRPLSRRIRA